MTSVESHRGRPRTGRVVRVRTGAHAGCWQGIVTLADGSTKRLEPFPREMSRARAKERTLLTQARYIEQGVRATPKDETPKGGGLEWWDKYLAHREAKGLSPVGFLYRPHIKPVLGDKHPKDWTREDCEKVSAALDAKIVSTATDRISWKTAQNIWGLFTKACKVTCSAKAAAGLRVRKDNPCASVEGPERGENKTKQWLYPSEMAKLLECEAVPLRWRRLYALLAYTYVRPSELKVLTWSDVNLDVGTIYVHKAWDRARSKTKAPKTRAGIRHVPIEPTLVPLLRVLHDLANGSGNVLPMPPAEDWAERFRSHLKRAGVDRAALFTDDDTHKQITLYDLRATGITWRCLRKDYGPEIQQAAGHEKYDTTDGYIRTARVFVGRIGEPFPALPQSLLTPLSDHDFRSRRRVRSTFEPNSASMLASPTGFEPVLQP